MSHIADQFRNSVPSIEDYFGLWAIHEPVLRAGVERFNQMDLHVHVQANAGSETIEALNKEREYEVLEGGVAVIGISGMMRKRASSMSQSSSTIAIRRQLRAAMNDSMVSGILLHIESPGGLVAGTKELADDVANAAKQKQVIAFVEDLGASAAYYVASQATKIYANEPALVGSIGTYAVIEDSSERAEKLGVKVHVIQAGAFKGTGEPGTPVTDDQLAYLQQMIESQNELFLSAVGAGRRMSRDKVAKIADGRVHMASAAVSLGLIDAVRTLDSVVAEMSSSSKKGKSRMSNETTTIETTLAAEPLRPAPATLNELKEAFPKASSDFVLSQLSAGNTMEQAAKAYARQLEDELTVTRQKAQDLQDAKAVEKTVQKVDGLKADGSTRAGATDASPDAFKASVEKLVASGMTRQKALAQAVREDPDGHMAYVEEHNAKHGR
jgi:signal peptide peptidase SppA